MVDRLMILTLVIAACLLAWVGFRLWQAARLRRLQAAPAAAAPASPLVGVVGDGPALLYFTTADCAQCRFQQTPILQKLQAQPTAPRVITLDALERQDLARHFGIMTVPSTVLVDSRRVPVAINHGVAPLQKLQAQVAAVR